MQERVCKRCHREATIDFGETWLCLDCYGTIGSCCMEFDGDDLFLEERSWWETRMEPKSAVPARGAAQGDQQGAKATPET